MKKTLSFVVYCFVLATFFASCKNVKGFEFQRIESWKVNDLSFNSSSISARISMLNPNKFPVTIKHVEGNVAVEGKDLGTCTSDTTLKVGAHQIFSLPVDVQVKTGALLLGGLAFLGKDSVLVKFDGYGRIGRSGVFINYKFNGESKVATNF